MFAQNAAEGEGPLNPAPPTGITPAEIISRFAEKEREFREALERYTYRQSVKVQTVEGNSVDGEYQMVVDILFDDKGKRTEQVVFAPQTTLQRISMSPQDFDDLENRIPFALSSDQIDQYDITYAGQQKVDEIDTYVFDVKPKKIEKNNRYFEGRIWVDAQDIQIVKTHGKNVPDIRSKKDQENLFPKFTTYREQIDGKYWFPTYSRADDTLKFTSGDVQMRMIVKYTNYKQFKSRTRITMAGEEIPNAPENAPLPQEEPQQLK
jgi:hypothetical protein